MKQQKTENHSFKTLFRNLLPYVRPYRGMIMGTLLLTLVGSFAAQVNPLIVNETVTRVESLIRLVQNFFLDILPLFSTAIIALVVMYNANLHEVSLTLEPGKTTAIVGLSGAGKSTLINLLCKFYQPDSGQITLDGIDLEAYENGSLRNQIGLVLQKNHIFKESIYDNILYGNTVATREEVVAAARSAFLHEQVEQLPEGYDTDAQQLSGGQQQRIAIARLFLKNPPVIFLDEPTASLDAIATEHIKMSLDAIKRDRTVVIISHSLSQIVDADAIYVIKEGRMVEWGTHASLYVKQGEYRKIFDASARSLNLEKMLDTLAG